jgi:hypothetical protein
VQQVSEVSSIVFAIDEKAKLSQVSLNFGVVKLLL